MSWRFREETRIGAENALDACDYFVDEVIEPWKILGSVDDNLLSYRIKCKNICSSYKFLCIL